MRLIAITGGIGAGKSVVSRILTAMGYEVYDCDSRAKAIMDCDPDIKQCIAQRISPQVIGGDGVIDRQLLASIVFNDSSMLDALNAIVHAAVRDDIARWAESACTDKPLFVETAILYQSGLDRMVDEVWQVTAPTDVCIDRVCRRNATTPEAVRARIRSQQYVPEKPHGHVAVIINDDAHSLLLQINALL